MAGSHLPRKHRIGFFVLSCTAGRHSSDINMIELAPAFCADAFGGALTNAMTAIL